MRFLRGFLFSRFLAKETVRVVDLCGRWEGADEVFELMDKDQTIWGKYGLYLNVFCRAGVRAQFQLHGRSCQGSTDNSQHPRVEVGARTHVQRNLRTFSVLICAITTLQLRWTPIVPLQP